MPSPNAIFEKRVIWLAYLLTDPEWLPYWSTFNYEIDFVGMKDMDDRRFEVPFPNNSRHLYATRIQKDPKRHSFKSVTSLCRIFIGGRHDHLQRNEVLQRNILWIIWLCSNGHPGRAVWKEGADFDQVGIQLELNSENPKDYWNFRVDSRLREKYQHFALMKDFPIRKSFDVCKEILQWLKTIPE